MKTETMSFKQMKEFWKDIEGYEGIYQVSNLGRVKRVTTGRILKSGKNIGGYLYVNLCKQRVVSNKRIHRLVAQAFIPNPEKKNQTLIILTKIKQIIRLPIWNGLLEKKTTITEHIMRE